MPPAGLAGSGALRGSTGDGVRAASCRAASCRAASCRAAPSRAAPPPDGSSDTSSRVRLLAVDSNASGLPAAGADALEPRG